MPACLEVCPTGSRKFGNVLDPDSEVAYILQNKRVFVLKEDVGTLPRFFGRSVSPLSTSGTKMSSPVLPIRLSLVTALGSILE